MLSETIKVFINAVPIFLKNTISFCYYNPPGSVSVLSWLQGDQNYCNQ